MFKAHEGSCCGNVPQPVAKPFSLPIARARILTALTLQKAFANRLTNRLTDSLRDWGRTFSRTIDRMFQMRAGRLPTVNSTAKTTAPHGPAMKSIPLCADEQRREQFFCSTAQAPLLLQ